VITLALRAENALHFRVVVKEGKEHGYAFDDRRSKLRLDPFPVLAEPPLDRIQLVELLRVRKLRVENCDWFRGNAFDLEFIPQVLRGFREIALFPGIVFEPEGGEFDRAKTKPPGRNRREMAPRDDLFGFVDALFEQRRRNSALIDVEQRDVVV